MSAWATSLINPITGESPSEPFIYNYISHVSNQSTIIWSNSTTNTINNLYVLVVGIGGGGGGSNGYGYGGGGGGAGGQSSLFLFTNCAPNDSIHINYNAPVWTTTTTVYAYLSYYRENLEQDLTSIGAYYYNIPNYATGQSLSGINFDSSLFLPITLENKLLINNNINILYGGIGNNGSGSSGGNGGNGGGGGGGGGGSYSNGSNGSRGDSNTQPGTYGGMSDATSSRDGGYTPVVMPDGTGTSSFPGGAFLGNAGNGGNGSGSLASNADSGSAMIFYKLPFSISPGNIDYIYTNGYYIVTIRNSATFYFNTPVSNVSVILVGGGGHGGTNSSYVPVYDGNSLPTEYSGGGGGGGGQTVLTQINPSTNPINITIGNGGISSASTNATSTKISYNVNTSTTPTPTTITALAGSNGGNAVTVTGGVGGIGGGNSGTGNGGMGYGVNSVTGTNGNPGTSITLINNIPYSFGGGGASGGWSYNTNNGLLSGGLGGGGGSLNGSLVNNGFQYIYTDNNSPPYPAPSIGSNTALYSINGLVNSGGGGAGAEASSGSLPGNGGSGIVVIYFKYP